MMILVKDQRQSFEIVDIITRVPQQHQGWESVRYQGKRYQVFGGIRTWMFIDIANPRKSRTGA